jgi:hypothetical protein
LDDIEASLQAGASLNEVRDTLAEKGVDLSFRAFTSALYRARKKRKANGRQTPALAPTSATLPPRQPPAPVASRKSAEVSGLNFKDAAEAVADLYTATGDSDLVKRAKEKEQKK